MDHTPCLLQRGSVGRLSVDNITSGYMAIMFISIGWMLFLASTLDNVDPLFASWWSHKVSSHLHNVEVADQDS